MCRLYLHQSHWGSRKHVILFSWDWSVLLQKRSRKSKHKKSLLHFFYKSGGRNTKCRYSSESAGTCLRNTSLQVKRIVITIFITILLITPQVNFPTFELHFYRSWSSVLSLTSPGTIRQQIKSRWDFTMRVCVLAAECFSLRSSSPPMFYWMTSWLLTWCLMAMQM